jgi:hypothetical protein
MTQKGYKVFAKKRNICFLKDIRAGIFNYGDLLI